jgi:hypothetical protein
VKGTRGETKLSVGRQWFQYRWASMRESERERERERAI